MDAYKKAALHLHALGRSDRRWILGRLPECQRGKLLDMLGELRTLGIPREPALLAAMDKPAAGADSADAGGTVDARSSLIETIAQASPSVIGPIVQDEDEAVVTAILQIHDWPWRQGAIEALQPSRRQRVIEKIPQMRGRLTDKVIEALLRNLAERLATVPVQEGAWGAEAPTSGKPVRGGGFFRRWSWRK